MIIEKKIIMRIKKKIIIMKKNNMKWRFKNTLVFGVVVHVTTTGRNVVGGLRGVVVPGD